MRDRLRETVEREFGNQLRKKFQSTNFSRGIAPGHPYIVSPQIQNFISF